MKPESYCTYRTNLLGEYLSVAKQSIPSVLEVGEIAIMKAISSPNDSLIEPADVLAMIGGEIVYRDF
jgi:capsular polysaccharide biosynthesis protein